MKYALIIIEFALTLGSFSVQSCQPFQSQSFSSKDEMLKTYYPSTPELYVKSHAAIGIFEFRL